MQDFLESFTKFKAMEAATLKKAEDDGEELKVELRTSRWRYSVPALILPGGSLEEAEHDVKVGGGREGGVLGV